MLKNTLNKRVKNMYAVVQSGNRQYRVSEGDIVAVEKLSADVGSQVALDRVLLLSGDSGVEVGAPVVEGARVTAEVVSHDRWPKVEIFRFKRRKNIRSLRGHRQPYTLLKILSVTKS
jgi:large subunit ribosomal protein L21